MNSKNRLLFLLIIYNVFFKQFRVKKDRFFGIFYYLDKNRKGMQSLRPLTNF